MNDINDFSKEKPYGWICPKCGRVMSPVLIECIYCNGTNNATSLNQQYIDIDYTKSISVTGENDKFSHIVQQVSKNGKVISPIKEE